LLLAGPAVSGVAAIGCSTFAVMAILLNYLFLAFTMK